MKLRISNSIQNNTKYVIFRNKVNKKVQNLYSENYKKIVERN